MVLAKNVPVSANTEGQNIHGKCATSAIANLHAQLKGLYGNKSDAEIDAMMGTTPVSYTHLDVYKRQLLT